ncbi:hypothetical protein [Apilactobacillus xinyiensis]|uniref:hypothetical protein n=1 Tax=Apilactobacillus xinyiensis TaxID=2841032 RepID=UPI003364D2B1
MQTDDYRKTPKLVIVNYVFLILSCIPGIGTLLNLIGIIDLIVLILSALILARRVVQSKTATYLAIIGSAIHFIISVTTAVMFAYIFWKDLNNDGSTIDTVYPNHQLVGSLMLLITVCAWLIRVIAAVLYTNDIFSKNKSV